VIKVSAVKAQHRVVEAPALVFAARTRCWTPSSKAGLQRDFVAVVRYQGPRANGMRSAQADADAGRPSGPGIQVALVTTAGCPAPRPSACGHPRHTGVPGRRAARQVRDGTRSGLTAEAVCWRFASTPASGRGGRCRRRTLSTTIMVLAVKSSYCRRTGLAAGAEQGAVIFRRPSVARRWPLRCQ